jgi:chromosome segregation ATPase
MAEPTVKTSQRFSRAARAERDRLARRRDQISKKRESLQATIDQLDGELEAVDEQILVLENLADPIQTSSKIWEVEPFAEEDGPKLLSGATIRKVAVPLLMREKGTSPIHYRDWFELIVEKGYAVSGKRPDAVFLNQVSRSPVVRATTKSGYYVLDPGVVDQLRAQLRQQQVELAERARHLPGESSQFQVHREGNRELKTAIARTERELDEAMTALDAAEPFQASETQAA